MTQAERGLFERVLEFVENNTDGNGQLWNDEGLRQICEPVEQRLAEAEAKLAQAEFVIAQKNLAITAAKQLLDEAKRTTPSLIAENEEFRLLLTQNVELLQVYSSHSESRDMRLAEAEAALKWCYDGATKNLVKPLLSFDDWRAGIKEELTAPLPEKKHE